MTRRTPDPSSRPIARCWTKAISREKPGRTVRCEKWVLARRGWLEFHDDRLVLLGYLGYLLWSRLS